MKSKKTLKRSKHPSVNRCLLLMGKEDDLNQLSSKGETQKKEPTTNSTTQSLSEHKKDNGGHSTEVKYRPKQAGSSELNIEPEKSLEELFGLYLEEKRKQRPRSEAKTAAKPIGRAYEQKRNRCSMGIKKETHHSIDGVVKIATVRSYGKLNRRSIQILAKINIRPSPEDKRSS